MFVSRDAETTAPPFDNHRETRHHAAVMPGFAPTSSLATHEVANQPPDFVGRNLFAIDPALRAAALREGGEWIEAPLTALGEAIGTEAAREWAYQANRHPPELVTFDRWGRRIDEVRFHPAYHALLGLAADHRIAAIAWAEPKAGAHVAHAALLALFSEVEQGTMCPVSMTYAAMPALRHAPALTRDWQAKILASVYDAPLRPIADKRGVMLGMAMTEKQGGSDLRATTTRAEPDGPDAFRLVGHKWFCSAPMSDGFLTLATTAAGLSCFLVPRITPDGARNAVHLMRLKDKLGNRSNASAEIEYHGAYAVPIGEPGRGIATILSMVHHTRLDTMASTLGLMRMALLQAKHHTTHRRAFGRSLTDQPAMRAVLADLQLDYEAAAVLTFRVARAFDGVSESERALARLGVAIGKYWITKRAAGFVAECLECLGGAGYIEEGPMPRLYREAPVNAIWEGSGNVIALDILRTIDRETHALEALMAELEAARGGDPHFDAAVAQLPATIRAASQDAAYARRAAEDLALTLSVALLIRFAPGGVAAAFCATRLEDPRQLYGTLTPGADTASLIGRIAD